MYINNACAHASIYIRNINTYNLRLFLLSSNFLREQKMRIVNKFIITFFKKTMAAFLTSVKNCKIL